MALNADKIRSKPFFGEVKPSALRLDILRHVKERYEHGRDILYSKFFIPCSYPPDLLLDDSAGTTAGELWWTKQEFSSVDIIQ
jgi:hypothetical protein